MNSTDETILTVSKKIQEVDDEADEESVDTSWWF